MWYQCNTVGTISIHALLAESDYNIPPDSVLIIDISIHALLAESDQAAKPDIPGERRFLSTLSLRRATLCMQDAIRNTQISIHALLAESDLYCLYCTTLDIHFYPRSPCGERLGLLSPTDPRQTFLSTLSLRRATAQQICRASAVADFYPRSPCGERR